MQILQEMLKIEFDCNSFTHCHAVQVSMNRITFLLFVAAIYRLHTLRFFHRKW